MYWIILDLFLITNVATETRELVSGLADLWSNYQTQPTEQEYSVFNAARVCLSKLDFIDINHLFTTLTQQQNKYFLRFLQFQNTVDFTVFSWLNHIIQNSRRGLAVLREFS